MDVLRAYLDPGSPLYAGVEEAVAAAGQVVAAARAAGVPVCFTAVRYAPGGSDSGVWWRKIPVLEVLTEGSERATFPDDPAPRPGEPVFVKQYASAFFGTSLLTTLVSAGVDSVIVVGLTTSGCVRATAVDALQYGFVPLRSATPSATGSRPRMRRTCWTSRPSTPTWSRR